MCIPDVFKDTARWIYDLNGVVYVCCRTFSILRNQLIIILYHP